jgi:PAS domain S-box-containing protein
MKDKPVILVVDDQLQNIELLEAYLIPQGYEIVRAASGEEALAKLSDNPIDLILLDVMMPGMDGFEVTRKVRQDVKIRLLPIILVTSLRETEDRIKGIEAGCDDFISKPVYKMELLARVRSLLKVKAYSDLMINSELRYRSLFETAQDGILILNALTGDITDANPFLINMLGYSKQELLGKKLWEIGFIKDSTAGLQVFQILQKKGYARYEDLLLETRDRKPMQVEFVSNLLTVNGHKVIQCNIRDITERKRTEEELKITESASTEKVLVFGDLEIDLSARRVQTKGCEVRLTGTEYRLLHELVLNAGKVMESKQLLHSVWGQEYGDDLAYLHEYIGRLRHKLEPDPKNPQYIITVHGVGYMFRDGNNGSV